MLFSIGDLTRFTAHTKDATFPIKDVFFSLSGRTLSFLTLDTGSWFESDSAIVSARLLTKVSTDDRTVTLDTDEAHIRDATRWSENGSSAMDALPPIVIGPFGNTISPAMMIAMDRNASQQTTGQVAQAQRCEQFSSMENMDVFGSDGELGRLIDLLLSPETREITHMVIDNGKVLAGRQLIVPIEKLRHQAEQETHLVLDLTSSELAAAPQLEYADRLNRNWIDALRNYYQLPV